MTYVVLVNEKAGTVRDRGRSTMKRDLESAFAETGAEADIRLVHPRNIEAELKSLVGASSGTQTIIVGGGDGTLSLAAGILAKSEHTLGVLPLGTMNLFARALLLPLDPVDAVGVLAKSDAKKDRYARRQWRERTHACLGRPAAACHSHSRIPAIQDPCHPFAERADRLGSHIAQA